MHHEGCALTTRSGKPSVRRAGAELAQWGVQRRRTSSYGKMGATTADIHRGENVALCQAQQSARFGMVHHGRKWAQRGANFHLKRHSGHGERVQTYGRKELHQISHRQVTKDLRGRQGAAQCHVCSANAFRGLP
jgi:hypothetical protein